MAVTKRGVAVIASATGLVLGLTVRLVRHTLHLLHTAVAERALALGLAVGERPWVSASGACGRSNPPMAIVKRRLVEWKGDRGRVSVVAVSFVVTLSCLACPRTLAAQERQGWWWGLGGGVCVTEAPAPEWAGRGVKVDFTGGWTFFERVRLGGEAWACSRPDNLLFTSYSAIVMLYPLSSSALFVKGGAGRMSIGWETFDVSERYGSGLGLSMGVGYDLPVTRTVSVTPSINLWHSKLSDIEAPRGFGGAKYRAWTHRIVDFIVVVTYAP
jgi:hypothetical protein